MGLRLNQGMHESNIPNLTSMSDLIEGGFLIKSKNDHVKSTLKGRLVLNTLIEKLL